jgi:hypothetical protein
MVYNNGMKKFSMLPVSTPEICESKKLSVSEVLCLITLVSFCRPTKGKVTCFPTLRTLSTRCMCSPEGMRKVVSRLEKMSLVIITRAEGKRKNVNVYDLSPFFKLASETEEAKPEVYSKKEKESKVIEEPGTLRCPVLPPVQMEVPEWARTLKEDFEIFKMSQRATNNKIKEDLQNLSICYANLPDELTVDRFPKTSPQVAYNPNVVECNFDIETMKQQIDEEEKN